MTDHRAAVRGRSIDNLGGHRIAHRDAVASDSVQKVSSAYEAHACLLSFEKGETNEASHGACAYHNDVHDVVCSRVSAVLCEVDNESRDERECSAGLNMYFSLSSCW
mmetsp:Transcript_14121/g.42536  ORF Transcript_14121/g.42536 Transcript_14121/m.42536 type:complete len:107 (+) Transcript_14121:2079-2399(+)